MPNFASINMPLDGKRTVASINMPLASKRTTTPGDIDDIIDWCVYLAHIDHAVYTVHPMETTASTPTSHTATNTDPDYEALHPYFGWLPFDMVNETFAHTTQYVRMPMSMKTDKHFVNTLEDNIWCHGAPIKLILDSAKVEISNKVKDILHALCISDWLSEAYQQQQNPAERRYQTIKSITNTILDHTGSPLHISGFSA
jgi:hypothetical protein